MTTNLRNILATGICLCGLVAAGCGQSGTPTGGTTPTVAVTSPATPPAPPATTPPPASPAAGSPTAMTSPMTDASPAASPATDASPGPDDASPAAGGTVMTHAESGLQFTLPEGWKQSQDGNALAAENADGSIVMLFLVTDQKDVKEVSEGIGSIVDETLDKVEVTEDPKEEEINGLTQVWAEGTGEYKGEAQDWDISVVVGAKKPMVVLAMGKIGDNEDEINGVYNSIKKI